MTETDKALFCAHCGSAMVEASIVSGVASCGICGWSGKVDELVAVPFNQKIGSPEEVLRQLSLEIRQLLSKSTATEFVRLLIKWGFIGQQIDKNEVARYFGVVAKGIATGLIEARQEIERERSMRS